MRISIDRTFRKCGAIAKTRLFINNGVARFCRRCATNNTLHNIAARLAYRGAQKFERGAGMSRRPTDALPRRISAIPGRWVCAVIGRSGSPVRSGARPLRRGPPFSYLRTAKSRMVCFLNGFHFRWFYWRFVDGSFGVCIVFASAFTFCSMSVCFRGVLGCAMVQNRWIHCRKPVFSFVALKHKCLYYVCWFIIRMFSWFFYIFNRA